MHENPKHGDAPVTQDDAFEHRVKYHRRVLARGCGRSPPSKLIYCLDHAAHCRALAEAIRNDPSVALTDKVAAFREERLALKALEAAKTAARPEPAPQPVPLLDLAAL